MEDLVQKLREASEFECAECALHYVAYDDKSESWKCGDISCIDCVADSFNALADCIEREYAPKSEPDAVEKVALGMLKFIEDAAKKSETQIVVISREIPAIFRKYLEGLGVKVDG